MKKGFALATCLTLLLGVLTGCTTSQQATQPAGQSSQTPAAPSEATKTEPMVLHWSINSEPPSMDPGIAVP